MSQTLQREGAPSASESVAPEPSPGFVTSPRIESITRRALLYLNSGYPVHFSGPTGTGKTTLAFHVAAQLSRPVTLIHGDDEFGSADLVGHSSGFRRAKLVDNFIHSVVKTEEALESTWVDNRLTTACRDGHVLVYDEFNRSKAEANNALLSVLSEGVLTLPRKGKGEGYLQVHPKFRAVFTSNPEEYAGVHSAQDALIDRMITIALGHFDPESEVAITSARSGLEPDAARVIVSIVREVRALVGQSHRPTVRACIAIARILRESGGAPSADDEMFTWICRDVLAPEAFRLTGRTEDLADKIADVVKQKAAPTEKPRAHRTASGKTVKKG